MTQKLSKLNDWPKRLSKITNVVHHEIRLVIEAEYKYICVSTPA